MRRPAVNDVVVGVPKWLPATLFIGLTLILFRDFVFSDRMLLGHDTLGLGYSARAWYADALAELGRFPRWQPMILGGTPFLEALSAGDSFYPPSLLLLVLMETHRALGWKLVLHVALAGFLMFGWLRSIAVSRAASLVGSVGYMAAPFFVSLVHPGHDGKMFVIALAPLLLWAVERHFQRPDRRTFSCIALVVGLILTTTHFQMAYFLFGATGLFAIFRAWDVWSDAQLASDPNLGVAGNNDDPVDGQRKERGTALRPAGARFGLFLAASLVGAGIAGFQLLPAIDYVTSDSRRVATSRVAEAETSVAWASSWSMHPEEAMSLLIPEFPGATQGDSDWADDSYWGRNDFKHNSEYIGLVLLLLAAVSFTGGPRRRLRWFLAGLGAVAFLFALGQTTPMWRVFYELLPGVGLFRAPSQVIFLTGLSVATLAGFGTDRLLDVASVDDDGWRRVQRVLLGALALMAFLVVFASSGTLTSLWTSLVYSDIPPERAMLLEAYAPFITRGAGIAFLLVAATTGLTWAVRSSYLAPTGLLAALVVLVSVDEGRINAPFVQTIDFETWSAPNALIQAVLDMEADAQEPYRLLTFERRGQAVDPSMHGIELAAGHHPNDLNRYRQLIGMAGSSFPMNLLDGRIRRLLNVRYIVWPDAEIGPAPEGPVVTRLHYRDGPVYQTLLAEDGLPRARLVGSAVVKSEDEAVPYMLSEAFDPEREVVLAEAAPIALPNTTIGGSVTWTERGPDRMLLSVRSEEPALLVVANNWSQHWHATANGVDVPVLRAYHSLQAIPVSAGSSQVEIWYGADVARRSAWLSVLLLLALGGANLVGWRPKSRA